MSTQPMRLAALALALLFLTVSQVDAQSLLATDIENLARGLEDRSLGHLTRAYGEGSSGVVTAWGAVRNAEARGEISLDNLPFVTFALFDSGVDIPLGNRHPEFDGIAFDPQAMTDTSMRADPSVDWGHGTLVAGIIGADNDSAFANYTFPEMNGVISGITDNYGFILERYDNVPIENRSWFPGKTNTFLNAIESMPDGTIVNMSFGARRNAGANDAEFQEAREAYIEGMRAREDMLFVMSAGNDNENASNHIPGGIDEPNAITVAALNVGLDGNATDRLVGSMSGSNFGSVNISAPGSNIYMPARRPDGSAPLGNIPEEDNYVFAVAARGTSFAAPFVTGTAGMLRALNESLAPQQIKSILIQSAEPIATGESDKLLGTGCYDTDNNPNNYTGCRLNAHAAVCHEDVLDCDGGEPPTPPPPAVGYDYALEWVRVDGNMPPVPGCTTDQNGQTVSFFDGFDDGQINSGCTGTFTTQIGDFTESGGQLRYRSSDSEVSPILGPGDTVVGYVAEHAMAMTGAFQDGAGDFDIQIAFRNDPPQPPSGTYQAFGAGISTFGPTLHGLTFQIDDTFDENPNDYGRFIRQISTGAVPSRTESAYFPKEHPVVVRFQYDDSAKTLLQTFSNDGGATFVPMVTGGTPYEIPFSISPNGVFWRFFAFQEEPVPTTGFSAQSLSVPAGDLHDFPFGAGDGLPPIKVYLPQ